MVAILVFCGGLSLLAALIMPFRVSNPLGDVTFVMRLMAAGPGLVGAIQFFALAVIIDGISSLRSELKRLTVVADQTDEPTEQIAPPPGWE